MNPNFALCQEWREECKTQSQSQAQFQFQLQLSDQFNNPGRRHSSQRTKTVREQYLDASPGQVQLFSSLLRCSRRCLLPLPQLQQLHTAQHNKHNHNNSLFSSYFVCKSQYYSVFVASIVCGIAPFSFRLSCNIVIVEFSCAFPSPKCNFFTLFLLLLLLLCVTFSLRLRPSFNYGLLGLLHTQIQRVNLKRNACTRTLLKTH